MLYLILTVLLMISLIQTDGHNLAALMVMFLQLSNTAFKQIRQDIE